MLPGSLPEVVEPEYETESEPGPVSLPALSEDPENRGSWRRKILIAFVIAVAAGFAAWKVHDNLTQVPATGRHSSEERAVPVIAVPVRKKEMPIYLEAPGTVTAYYSVTMRTRVDGQLLTVNIREGQFVRKGQLLAQIDPAPYQAALAQAEGQLAKDQAAAVYARAAAERYQTLYNAGVVSKDREQTQASAAGEAEGAILADKAAIDAAKVNLAFARIVSPIDGVVGLRQIDPGNIVHATDATGLFLVTQLDPIAVIFTLPEDQLPPVKQALRAGKTLNVEAYDHAETTLLGKGKLLTLDNQIDTATGTDKVKAVFENRDGVLFPNQFVNVRLILKKEPDALVIPAAAVQTGSMGSFVYVVKSGIPPRSGSPGAGSERKRKSQAASDGAGGEKGESAGAKFYAEVRSIAIDATEGSDVIVRNGLAAGDQVVIDGLEKLRDRSAVVPRQSGGSGGHHKKENSADDSAQPSQQAGSDQGKHAHQGNGQ
ncbi:MAG TPA: efflux RND transporter periplasmic adaptor subunit [Terracidiphilus sp.]|nr:efflux RND transporter periplasmic adaptor subunit [Terracidiphilus sp.]